MENNVIMDCSIAVYIRSVTLVLYYISTILIMIRSIA